MFDLFFLLKMSKYKSNLMPQNPSLNLFLLKTENSSFLESKA